MAERDEVLEAARKHCDGTCAEYREKVRAAIAELEEKLVEFIRVNEAAVAAARAEGSRAGRLEAFKEVQARLAASIFPIEDSFIHWVEAAARAEAATGQQAAIGDTND